ncbi:hypothetical protein QBC39DRAFT_328710 [Podospora conica]|nr:hypothetical protein QBC39DRAFT_328710 [Schizothecium conicum]
MTLSCRSTNEALHGHGKTATKAFLNKPASLLPYKTAESPEDEPVIPAPEIFQETNDSNSDSETRLPSISECAIHLELLEAFLVLRERIIRSTDIDMSMEIAPKRETKTGVRNDTLTLKDDTLGKRRQEKWPKFVQFAVARFLEWRAHLNRKYPLPPVKTDTTKPFDGPLPPLDVLMVWHAFLLNPLLFNHTCRQERLYIVEFPWQAIHARINNHDWSFTSLPEDDHTFPPLFDVFSTWSEDFTATCKPSLNSFTLTSVPSAEILAPLDADSQIRRHADAIGSISDTTLALALRDAVIRQTSFVDKMNAHLWIRSPALPGTIRRAVDRYAKFLHLLKRKAPPLTEDGGNRTIVPGPIIVPTLDIDLVWHTHQCSAYRYVKATNTLVGRFVNHDDTIGKPTLADGSLASRRLFRLHFGEEYRKCGCWDCEALLSELEDRAAAAARGEGGEVDMVAVAARVERTVQYHRAVEAARRKGGRLPVLGG